MELIALLLSVLLLVAGVRQDVTPEPPAEIAFPFVIESVTPIVSDTVPAEIALDVHGAWPTGCTGLPVRLTQTNDGSVITLELAQIGSAAIACPAVIVPYDDRIRLSGAYSGGPLTVSLNGFNVIIPAISEGSAPDESPTGSSGGLPMTIETVEVRNSRALPGQFTAHVTGTLPTGCTALPTQVQQDITTEGIAITISQLVPDNVRCTMAIVPFELDVPVWGAYDTLPPVTVNGVFETSAQSADDAGLLKLPIVVDEASAEVSGTAPAEITVTVTGSLPTGCADLPVQTVQRREGRTVVIEITQLVPQDQICTMMIVPYTDTIPLGGSFPAGRYTIQINSSTLLPVTVSG